MNKIKILSDELIQKIAAGEVIERPASVVKELVENSIDAGATHISVEILNEGKRLIRVVDNGVGMSRVDMEICIKKHSTSKITSFEDLFYLHTLGFRGEALASIASISKLEIMSKPQVSSGEKSALSGTVLKVENQEEEINDIGCSEGTT
ncbi:MAG: DNA mismatch repair endonuclease MutL, partial [Candidatus Firestonebacteria bacterium]